MHSSLSPAATPLPAYSDSNGQPDLLDSLVAYLDELGTSQKILRMTTQDLRSDLERYKRLLWFLDGDPTAGGDDGERDSPEGKAYVLNAFTDNLSLCRPLRAPGDPDDVDAHRLFVFLQGIALYQGNTVCSGTLLRGAITRGRAYAKPGYVTGPAHLAAVIAEETTVIYPKVMVDRDVVRLVDDALAADPEANELFDGLLIKDKEDGEYYLDYLLLLICEDAPPPKDVRGILAKHRRVVLRELQHCSDPSARKKLEWLARYHDGVCDRLGVPHLKEPW